MSDIEKKSIDHLSHGELCSLLSNHVVLLLIELPPVSQLSAQFLQLHNLDRVRLNYIYYICLMTLSYLGWVIKVQLSTSQLLQLTRQLVNLKIKS